MFDYKGWYNNSYVGIFRANSSQDARYQVARGLQLRLGRKIADLLPLIAVKRVK